MSSWKRLHVAMWLVLLGIAGVGDAQTFRGGITGRVADSTGAVLPGVTVTATNDATGVSRTTTTSTGGDFSVPDLQLGTYTIEATLQGFQTLRTKVEVIGLADRVGGAEDGAVAGRRDDQRHRVRADARHGVDRAQQRRPAQAGAGSAAQRPRLHADAAAGARRRRHVGERRAHARQQLPDRRRRQQRRVPERRGGQPGRRLRHRRHAAADRGDRSVLGAVGRPGGDGPQRRLDGEPRDQVGHQRRSRQRVLLQPQRGAVGELAGGGARTRRSARFATTSTASRSAVRSCTARRSSSRRSRSRS